MATTVNLEGLIQDYINAHRDEIIAEVPTQSKTVGYLYGMYGVKHKDVVPKLDSTVVLGDGSACGWAPDGSDVYTNVEIEVNPAEVEKEICQRDFEKTNLNHELRWAAGQEKLPFAEAYINSNLAAINDAIEHDVWQGNATVGLDGLLAQVGSAVTTATTVDFSGMTADEKIAAMVEKVPHKALKYGVDIFLSNSDFAAYAKALNANCCANRAVIDASSDEYVLPENTKIRLIPVEGLEGTGKMVAAPRMSLVYGTDVEGSENIVDFWFDRKDAKFLFRVLFMIGTALRRPDLVVLGA